MYSLISPTLPAKCRSRSTNGAPRRSATSTPIVLLPAPPGPINEIIGWPLLLHDFQILVPQQLNLLRQLRIRGVMNRSQSTSVSRIQAPTGSQRPARVSQEQLAVGVKYSSRAITNDVGAAGRARESFPISAHGPDVSVSRLRA